MRNYEVSRMGELEGEEVEGMTLRECLEVL